MTHKCSYCGKESKGTRDQLIDAGWFFVEIRTPKRKYLKACPEHIEILNTELIEALGGRRR